MTALVLSVGALLTGQARQGVPAGRGTAAAPAPAGQRPASRGPAVPTGRPVRVLFLGMDEERPHNPARMFPHLAAPLARRGIQLTYVADQAQALDPEKLKYYDVADDLWQSDELSRRRRRPRSCRSSKAAKGWSPCTPRLRCSRTPTNTSRWSARSSSAMRTGERVQGRGHTAIAPRDAGRAVVHELR